MSGGRAAFCIVDAAWTKVGARFAGGVAGTTAIARCPAGQAVPSPTGDARGVSTIDHSVLGEWRRGRTAERRVVDPAARAAERARAERDPLWLRRRGVWRLHSPDRREAALFLRPLRHGSRREEDRDGRGHEGPGGRDLAGGAGRSGRGTMR